MNPRDIAKMLHRTGAVGTPWTMEQRQAVAELEQKLAGYESNGAGKVLTVPQTVEDAQIFIGGHYMQMKFGDESGEYEDKTRITYTLSIHDLLSCFDWWDFHNELLATRRDGVDKKD